MQREIKFKLINDRENSDFVLNLFGVQVSFCHKWVSKLLDLPCPPEDVVNITGILTNTLYYPENAVLFIPFNDSILTHGKVTKDGRRRTLPDVYIGSFLIEKINEALNTKNRPWYAYNFEVEYYLE